MYTFEPRNTTVLDGPRKLSFQNRDLMLSEAGRKPGQGADTGFGMDFFPAAPRANRGRENSHLNAVNTSSTMLKMEGLR